MTAWEDECLMQLHGAWRRVLAEVTPAVVDEAVRPWIMQLLCMGAWMHGCVDAWMHIGWCKDVHEDIHGVWCTTLCMHGGV